MDRMQFIVVATVILGSMLFLTLGSSKQAKNSIQKTSYMPAEVAIAGEDLQRGDLVFVTSGHVFKTDTNVISSVTFEVGEPTERGDLVSIDGHDGKAYKNRTDTIAFGINLTPYTENAKFVAVGRKGLLELKDYDFVPGLPVYAQGSGYTQEINNCTGQSIGHAVSKNVIYFDFDTTRSNHAE